MAQDRITALYARVSTEEQAREGQSIENQIDRLTAYAKFQGWQNVQVFADYGESAKSMDRPEMQRLIKLIKRNKVAVVATMAVDRLSRDLLDMLQFVQLCEEHGAAYVCAALNFDTGTPIGRMVLQILAAFAEFERSMIAARVKSNMTDIAQKQKRYMAMPPYGYELDEHKNLVVVPEEAQWVKQIADRFIAGHGYRKIASWLNELGVKTRKGNQWYSSTIRQILTNETYTGSLVWNRRYIDKAGKHIWRDPSEWIVHENAHPAILSEEQWAEIQKRIKRRMPKGGEKQMKYRLSGLLRCGECGQAMVSRQYGNKGPHRDRRIYVCSGYQKSGTCRFHYVFMDEIEQDVYEALEAFAGGMIDIPASALEKAAEAREEEFKRRLAAIDQKFQRQIQAFENGLISERDLRIARQRVEKERELLEQDRQRTQAPAEEEVRQMIRKEAKQLLWLWQHGELPVLQNALRIIIDGIVIVDSKIAEIRLSEELFLP
jgi:site-specific DNA recombinase